MTKLNAMSKEIAPYMRGIMTMESLKNTSVKLSWESSFNTEAQCWREGLLLCVCLITKELYIEIVE